MLLKIVRLYCDLITGNAFIGTVMASLGGRAWLILRSVRRGTRSRKRIGADVEFVRAQREVAVDPTELK
jgi:hypothetical protein